MPTGDPIDLSRQLRGHLESLQAAGVLFVPRGAPVTLRLVPQPLATPIQGAPETPADPLETRRRELTTLRDEVAGCDKCRELFSTRTQTVFGAGSLDPTVAFVGEAPGPEADAQGEPFAGKGGELLVRMIGACGFTTAQVYQMNIIKCRPPKNREPSASECLNCRDYFRRQFDLVLPKYVVSLGAFASRALTGQNATLADLRGKVHQYRSVPLICTHHPDAIEKDSTGVKKRETWEDLKMLLREMGRPLPGAK